MSTVALKTHRVLSGMRPTGKLHLGHYHGVLKNWIKLQHEYECFFCVVDWHALTTHYQEAYVIRENLYEVVIDWLGAGLDPGAASLFIQSQVPEHAELHLMLSMITPLGWLERVPTYKEQQEKLQDKDLSTYGFLGYPLLQAADILTYKAGFVPVGEDQVPHVELTREIARRFNHIFGCDQDYIAKARAAIAKLGKKNAKLYREHLKNYQERGQHEALEAGRALIEGQHNLSLGDQERLFGYLEGGGKIIFPEPDALLTPAARMPGLDGQKMSKSYNNTIGLRDDLATVEQKIRTMPTDPARVRRQDPGDPDKCPLYEFHKIYSTDDVKSWVQEGCRSAGIGCLECKQPVIDSVKMELIPIQERAREFEADPGLVRGIIAQGTEAARDIARDTLEEVRDVMGLAD